MVKLNFYVANIANVRRDRTLRPISPEFALFAKPLIAFDSEKVYYENVMVKLLLTCEVGDSGASLS